ncbi:MAG TPA: hypothetical protein VGK19_15685 [Capsulimonadaceae bacterium]|jgi:hypothetical protein
MATRSNRYVHALKEGANVIGLSTIVAATVATLSPLPLLVGAVAEAAYLLFVPDSKWYESRLNKRGEQEIIRRREALKAQLLPKLEFATQNRFKKLEDVRQQISSHDSTDSWLIDIGRKLDYLLEKFLVFATKELEFRRYLTSVWRDECGGSETTNKRVSAFVQSATDPPQLPGPARIILMTDDIVASYKKQIDVLSGELAKEQDPNTKAVMQKRIEVLTQRNEGVAKIGKIRTNLQYQVDLLEDTFGLINDQVRARSPEQVVNDIEGVVDQTESMTQLLEELAPYEQSQLP